MTCSKGPMTVMKPSVQPLYVMGYWGIRDPWRTFKTLGFLNQTLVLDLIDCISTWPIIQGFTQRV